MSRLARWHLRLLHDLARWVLRRRDGVPPGANAMPYAAADRGFAGVMVAVSVAEIAVVELAVPWPAARGVLLALGLYSLLVLLGLLAAGEVRPHVLTAGALRLRSGGSFDWVLPLDEAESVTRRTRGAGMTVQLGEDELLLPAGGATNLEARLRRPLPVTVSGRTASVRRVAFAADDAAAAAALVRDALAAVRAAPPEPGSP